MTAKLVPVFTPEELTRLEQACAGRSFAQRRDTAIIAVLTATGIRLSELAGLRRTAGDVDLWQREITVRGKGGKDRIVKIGHQAARSLDRYLRARSRHAQAWRPQLWLGVDNREPLTAAGIYQMIARRGRQCRRGRLPAPVPAPLQPHLAGPRRPRGRPDGTQRLDLPADAPPLRRQRPQRPRPPHLRPHHDRHIRPPPCAALPGHPITGTAHPASSGASFSRPASAGCARSANGPEGTWRRIPLSPDQPSTARHSHCGPSREPAPTSRSPKSLNGRLREPPEASGGPHRNPTSPRPGPPPRVPHGHDGTPRHTPALLLK